MDLKKVIDRKADAAKYMVDDITYIIKNFEKREPGSKGEKQACEYMAGELKKLGCEKADLEPFEEHPRSFFGWIFFTITMVLIGIPLVFFFPFAGSAIILAGLIIVFLQFGLYKKVVDPFFKKKIGHNVYAVKKPTGEVKRRIVFNGHPDAAWEWPVNYKFGGVGFESHAVLCGVGAVLYLVLGILAGVANWKAGLGFINSAADLDLGAGIYKVALCGLIFVIPLVGLYFMVNYNRIVDGANDNLSGCYMGIAILKYLKEEGIELENTEIDVILTGSEEAGLRGAKAFCADHPDIFKDVPTYIFSYDTIYDPKYLMANYRNLNGTVKSDKVVSDLFMIAAEQVGVPCIKGWVPPLGGATDDAAFTQAGHRATGITALNHKLENYYHTRRDTYDNMNEEGLANCYAASVKALEIFDSGEYDNK